MLLASVVTQASAAALSLIAAFLFVLGLALQQKGNLAAMTAEREGRARRFAVLTTVLQPAWLAGIAVGGVLGFVFLAVALRIGSLTIVEPMQVTQMIFTVPLSAWVARTSITRREWQAALVLVAGLGLVVLMVAPEPGQTTGSASGWTIVIPVVLVAAALLVAAARRVPDFAAALLGAACGVMFGLQGALVKEVIAMVGDGFSITGFVTSWSPYATVALTLVAVLTQNLALRAGRLSAAQTTITTTGPLVSAAVGVIVFAETLAIDPLRLGGAVIGLALCGWGISHLARSPSLVAVAVLTHADDHARTAGAGNP